MNEKATGELLFATLASKFDEAWNGRDAAKVASFLTQDADFVFPDGTVVDGREAIETFYANRFLNMLPGVKHKLVLKTVRYITSDTAIVDFGVIITDSDAPDASPSLDGRSTWVAVKENDQWITAAVRVMSPK